MERTGPVVAGLDVSLTSTGVAKVHGGLMEELPWTFCIRSSRKGIERLDSQQSRIGKALREIDPDLIVMEGPLPHVPKGGAAFYHENAGLHWLVRHGIWRWGKPLAMVNPTSLKMFAAGKGNASKTAMAVAAAVRFGIETGEDETDALWLAAAGLQHLGCPMVKMPLVNVNALDKVQWP